MLILLGKLTSNWPQALKFFLCLSLASVLLLLGFFCRKTDPFFLFLFSFFFSFFWRKLLVSFDNKWVVLVLCSNTFFLRFGCVKIGLIVFIVGACQQLIDWLSTTCQNLLWYYEKGKEWYGKNNWQIGLKALVLCGCSSFIDKVWVQIKNPVLNRLK